jgi:hypothetical protein
MESGPAIFAGAAFTLFGTGLLLWTGVRVAQRAPVAHGVSPAAAVAWSLVAGSGFVTLGAWCFSRL